MPNYTERKMHDVTKEELLMAVTKGETITSLAKKYKVTRATIYGKLKKHRLKIRKIIIADDN